jgi:hypothetical protein
MSNTSISHLETYQSMTEMLQQFDTLWYLSSLELKSVFLQIPLKETCRNTPTFFWIQNCSNFKAWLMDFEAVGEHL